MIDAGDFCDWLESFIQTMKGTGGGSVPCGDCVACCTSSKFILIRPTDIEALQSIPREIMFPAPGLSKGYFLLGYDENGYCPMFKNGKCSIYDIRPETCRQYDCRVLAAAGASIDNESSSIAKRITMWSFSYTKFESKELSKAVKLAMVFLKKNVHLFPPGFLPESEPQIAAMAIRVHGEFIGHSKESIGPARSTIVTTILSKYCTLWGVKIGMENKSL